eukprot:15432111-Alexandrium_andersonii.AAC.1
MACHPAMVRSAARTMAARAQGNTAGQAPQLSDSMCARQDCDNVLYGERSMRWIAMSSSRAARAGNRNNWAT